LSVNQTEFTLEQIPISFTTLLWLDGYIQPHKRRMCHTAVRSLPVGLHAVGARLARRNAAEARWASVRRERVVPEINLEIAPVLKS
jgi:hypothetical protein